MSASGADPITGGFGPSAGPFDPAIAGIGACVVDSDCDDGLFCTGMEVCLGGICFGQPPCTNDGNDCTDDICLEADAICLHLPSPSGTVCGDQSDTDCDNPDTCDGAGACQPNTEPANVECRPAAGACDVAEFCDGAGSCPFDGFEPSNVVCRPAAGDCDVTEFCDGAGGCPGNGFEPLGTVCEDGDGCTESDTCDGNGGCAGGDLKAACEAELEPATVDTACACPVCKPCVEDAQSANAKSVLPHSGEVNHSETDLRIAGRGQDFVWCREYRSKVGPNTAQGNGWDFSYNISVEAQGPDLVLHSGNTRRDTFTPQGVGTWTRREYFRVINENLDGSLTLTFEDTGTWNMQPLDGSPAQGRISSIVERNGNTLSFDYDGLGRLIKIHDTLDTPAHNRDIVVAYNADGFIESVTDFVGRSITYEYYDGIEPGGNFGDLKSATTPDVVGTPTGNDFPDGKTTVYTYSTGFADNRLNHNLLTITDPKGQTFLINEYAPTADPLDLNFDRIVRQTWGNPGDIIDFVYAAQTPSPGNGFATVKATVNDRVGDVKAYLYDDLNRLVTTQEHTGRADADLPTDLDLNINLPLNPLRPGDPALFETRYEWNADSLKTRIVHPNGNEDVYTYDEANPNRRAQGNMLQDCRLAGPLGGDQTQICETYEYDDGFGGCCGTNFVTRHVDGRGNETLHTYDGSGNRTHTQHRIPSIVEDFEYNVFGQMTSRTLPDNGSANRRRDEYTYYAVGIQLGYRENEIVDAPGFALTTGFEYDSLGRPITAIDPRGHDTQYVYNQLDQLVRRISREVTDGGGVRYDRNTFYDANDNVVRVDVQNKDDAGVLQANTHLTRVYEYEILNHRTKECHEVGNFTGAIPGPTNLPFCSAVGDFETEFMGFSYAYDANRNRTLVRYGEAVNGNDPANEVAAEYDERDLVFREIRAPGAVGPGGQSTDQYDYDGNRNTVRISEGTEDVVAPRISTSTYDGYDRIVTSVDPMGNVTEVHYDPNSNVGGFQDPAETIPNPFGSRVSGEVVDIVGSAGNTRLSEMTCKYDDYNRPIKCEVEFFDTDTQTPILIPGVPTPGKSTTTTEWSDNSQIVRRVNDNNHQTIITYDTANRRSAVTDHLNNTTAYEYDANSNVTVMTDVEKSDLGNPDEVFATTYTYDNLDRIVQTVDNVGNTDVYAYDSRDNQTFTNDALNRQTRYEYDAYDRLIKTVRDLNDDGANVNAVPGDGDPDIVTTQTWDDTSRLVGQTDDSDNTTTYEYDALNRLLSEFYADATVHAYTYDVHDNRLTALDANGSLAESADPTDYDLLDRLVRMDITRGPGVSNDITFENYQYDGLSRLVSAEDDDSLVTRSHDSLSRVTRETLNGATTTCLYDGEGNELTSTYPSGRAIECTFDELERKKTITDTTGAPALIATYDYVGPGRVTRREYGNGTRTDYAYDGITGVANPTNDFGVKQIIGTTHSKISNGTILDDRTYVWDRMYNKLQRKDVRAVGPRLTHNYTYDSLYRLVQTTATNFADTVVRDTSYDLDGVGNRTLVSGTLDPGSYVMDAALPEPADRQMNQYTKTAVDTRQYDLNGNLIAQAPFPAIARPLAENFFGLACASADDPACTNTSFCVPDADGNFPGTCYVPKNRYLSIDANPNNAGQPTARRLSIDSPIAGTVVLGWVGPPTLVTAANEPPIWFATVQATSHYTDWGALGGTLHVGDCEIAPGDGSVAQIYLIESIPQGADEVNPASYAAPLVLRTTIKYGDTIGPLAFAGQSSPPENASNFQDIFAAVAGFQQTNQTASVIWLDLTPEVPDGFANFADIFGAVTGFQTDGAGYPFGDPQICPAPESAASIAATEDATSIVTGDTSERQPAPMAILAAAPSNITYDYRNQMVEFVNTDTGQRHTYAYDALGRRIVRVVDADGLAGTPSQTQYFYDGWQVCESVAIALPIINQDTFVYGLYVDEVLNMQRLAPVCVGGGNDGNGCLSSFDCFGDPCVPVQRDLFYHTDDLYNVMAVTDATCAVVERYEYADYGQPIDPTNLVPIAGDPSVVGNPYGFDGRRYDPETAWYYYRTRYLDPVAGRFVTRNGMNTLGNAYTSHNSNPWTNENPHGLAGRGLLFADEAEVGSTNECWYSDAGLDYPTGLWLWSISPSVPPSRPVYGGNCRGWIRNADGSLTRLWSIGPSTNSGIMFGDAADILALIDALNGVTPLPGAGIYSPRNSVAGPEDILRVIDLLNGASAVPKIEPLPLLIPFLSSDRTRLIRGDANQGKARLTATSSGRAQFRWVVRHSSWMPEWVEKWRWSLLRDHRHRNPAPKGFLSIHRVLADPGSSGTTLRVQIHVISTRGDSGATP